MKQLLISMIGICVGFGGIAFCFRPIDLPLHPSYDNLANILPVARLLALVAGVVIICLAVIPLFTRRRPVPVLILMLVGTFLGLFVGLRVANSVVPNYRYRSAPDEQRTRAGVVYFSAAALGGVLPLVIIVWRDARKQPTDERPT